MADDFPFPSKESAYAEIKRDPCYAKLDEKDLPGIIDRAWETGAAAALSLKDKMGNNDDFFGIAASCGLKVLRRAKDNVIGNTRYFSEYLSGKSEITLYTISIRLWAAENKLSEEDAQNMILAHEFFHFLECTKIGRTSKQVLVPMIKIGSFTLGKTGIGALSEIGAHAFVRAYFGIPDTSAAEEGP